MAAFCKLWGVPAKLPDAPVVLDARDTRCGAANGSSSRRLRRDFPILELAPGFVGGRPDSISRKTPENTRRTRRLVATPELEGTPWGYSDASGQGTCFDRLYQISGFEFLHMRNSFCCRKHDRWEGDFLP